MDPLFIFKKAVTPFLLPPGVFAVLLMVIGAVTLFRRHWRIGLLNMILGAALWALSTAPVAGGLMRGLEAPFAIPDPPSGDVIILLGGGTIQPVPDLTGSSAPSPLMMGRVVTAVRLYRRLGVPILVTGGRWSDAEASEAAIVKRFLVDLGVPESAVIEEGQARDTAQNARFAAAICRQRNFQRPLLLTAAYHLNRARRQFAAEGMAVVPFPAYFLGAGDTAITWRDLLPRAYNLHTSANALHEYLGLAYTWLVVR